MNKVIRLSIPAMKCNGCVTTIEKALNSETGVNKVTVDLETKSASVETDVTLDVLVSTLKSAGFDATEISSE